MEERDLALQIARDRDVRKAVSRESFYWFFNIYFSHYVHCETAEFQREMFKLLEDEANKMLVFVAFRDSGKSTIISLAYALWAILGQQAKKYIVIAGLTQRQARQYLQNIKDELERNSLLRGDLGPFREVQDEWGSLSLAISNYGARITAASIEQSIRGLRHGAYRPQVIICDDIEDLASVQTMETRDKVYRWFSGDLIPSGGQDSRIIVAGNMLHKDSLIMRLKSNIEGGKMTGLFRSYPLLDGSGTCLWPGKFPNEASIEAVRKKLGNYNSWMREYMLTILPEDDQLVPSEWIRYYDNIPSEDDASYRYTLASFDLAISQKDGADFTAGIIARVFGWRDTLRIYILPHPINKRLNFPEQLAAIKALSMQYKRRIKMLIEANGYQRALPEQLVAEGYPVEGVQNLGSDKRARLSLATPLLKNGNVLFPKEGADTLIRQLVGFGAEKHDDLADAFSMLADYCVQHDEMSPLETLDFFFRLNPHLLTPGTDRLHKRF